MLVAGVDVGGTNIEVGLVDDDHAVVDRTKEKTPVEGPQSVVDAVARMIDGFDDDVSAVGMGIPGAVQGDEVVKTPNLQGWSGPVDLVDMLGAAVDRPVALGNDANVGLLGEWVAGSARGHADVLGVWMGTGVGGGLVLDGRPHTGSLGSAGEIGHVVVRADGALCPCGSRGCVEAYAGRRTMTETAQALVDAGEETRLFEIQEEEGKNRATSKVWAQALEEDDPVATRLFDAAIESVGLGLANAVNLLDLSLVVIGGGMAEKLGQDLADRIGAAAAPAMLSPNPDLRFVVAELGDDAGVVGAAELGRSKLILG